jgi:prenyl protein peptidase
MSSTALSSLGFTTAYLASIYLLPSSRVSHLSPSASPPRPPAADVASSVPATPRRDRNHPSVIKARLIAVSLASTASAVALPLLVSPAASSSWAGYKAALPLSLKLLGLTLPTGASAVQVTRLLLLPGLGLTASLFAGTFYIQHLAGELPWQREWRGAQRGWSSVLRSKFDGLKGLRNLVVVRGSLFFSRLIQTAHPPSLTGSSYRRVDLPELRHRCFLPRWLEQVETRFLDTAVVRLGCVYLYLFYSSVRLTLLIPTAHVHHAWETYLAGGRTKQALLQGIFSSSVFLSVLCFSLTDTALSDSLPIRLHHPLWLVRRFPVHSHWFVASFLSCSYPSDS